MVFLHDLMLNHVHNLISFLEATMHHQPTRAFWYIAANEQYCQSKHSTHTKGKTPAQVYREKMRIQQKRCRRGTKGSTHPPRTIDRQVSPATRPGWNQFVNGGVNGCIFATNTSTCQEATSGKPEKVHGKCCGDCC